jgi:hypothetical protein
MFSFSGLPIAWVLVLSAMRKDVTIVTTEIHVKLAWSVCSVDIVPSNMNKEISQIVSEIYVELGRSVGGLYVNTIKHRRRKK